MCLRITEMSVIITVPCAYFSKLSSAITLQSINFGLKYGLRKPDCI